MLFVASCIHSVNLRLPYLDVTRTGEHTWGTAHTLNSLKTWYFEGARSLNFLNVAAPKNFLHQTLKQRSLYISYPPGTLLLPGFISSLSDSPPEVDLLHLIGIFNHIFSGIVLFLLVRLVFKSLDVESNLAYFLSSMTASLFMILPATMYFFFGFYFADQSVVPLFILAVYLEAYRVAYDQEGKSLSLLWFTCFVQSYGMMTDFLFCFLAPLILISRVLFREKQPLNLRWLQQTFIVLGFPVLLTLGIWGWQLYTTDTFGLLLRRFTTRSNPGIPALNWTKEHFYSHFEKLWVYILEQTRGKYSHRFLYSSLASLIILLIFSLSSLLRTKKFQVLLVTVASILIPSMMQVHFLTEHQLFHSFSTLKFYTALVIGVPLLVGLISTVFSKYLYTPSRAHTASIAFLAIAMVALVNPLIKELEPTFIFADKANKDEVNCIELKTILHEIDRSSLVFSQDYQVPIFPPEDFACAGIAVYNKSQFQKAMNQWSHIQDDTYILERKEKGLHKIKPILNEHNIHLETLKQTSSFSLYKLKVNQSTM